MTELIQESTLAEYEAFVQSHPKGHFAQSSLWAKQKPAWKWRAIVSRGADGRIRGSIAFLIRTMPYIHKTMLYACRGPVCDLDDRETFGELVAAARELAKEYKAYVIKIDPDVPIENEDFRRMLEDFGFRTRHGGKNFEAIQPKFVFRLWLNGRTEDELMAIPDVGPTTAAYLRAWFANPQSQHQIRLLRAAGVSFESREQVVDHRFAGKTFVLTGALEHFSRDEAGAIIERFGGKTSSSVSKKTSYLLAGENTGSKYQKALTLGTPIITEAEFLDMIRE